MVNLVAKRHTDGPEWSEFYMIRYISCVTRDLSFAYQCYFDEVVQGTIIIICVSYAFC